MTQSAFEGRRAHSMAEMAQLNSRMMSGEDVVASIAAYKARPTDIVISPAGKCGTTLLQQTFHTLRTRGDMDFDDVSRVVPWIETAKSLRLDINADQVAQPRGFKSHLSWDQIPKGAKYIVSLRDPKDAFASAYRFMEGWFFEPGTISYEEFFADRADKRGKATDYWAHLVSWWRQRDNPSVLLLAYEHMVENPEANIQRIANFCEIPLDDELLALTLAHTSREFMLEHKDRFDDHLMRQLTESKCGVPAGSDSAKVRAASTGPRREELPQAVSDGLDRIWSSDVAGKIDMVDYAAVEAELRARATD
ncbi:MAG: sulfotransferase domain-containing protein [Pseudomonadales bacterium]